MIFKKVEITKLNSADITVLENVNLWFSGGLFDGNIFLYIGDLKFTGLKVKKAFWIPDNLIEFETIEIPNKTIDLFKIKAYL